MAEVLAFAWHPRLAVAGGFRGRPDEKRHEIERIRLLCTRVGSSFDKTASICEKRNTSIPQTSQIAKLAGICSLAGFGVQYGW
jgi:hypothetical protein